MTRLRRSRTTSPGIRRIRRGRGVGYLDPTGAPVREPAELDRFARLAIPPAWRDVWISPHPRGHIQATGLDDAGRRQYLYHPAWRARADERKYERMLELAAALPAARRRATADLRGDGLTRERVLAGAFRMLDSACPRVGSPRYATEHGSFGLASLLVAHATVRDGVVALRFPAKSGQRWESMIADEDLAVLVTALCARGRRARLLAWVDDHGRHHPIRPEDINEDIRRRTGGDFTAKDFRTLRGTAAAARSLAESGPAATAVARRRAIAEAVGRAAEVLGNTPAIARTSYVDPRVLDRYEQGETVRPRGAGIEGELIRLLRDPSG